MRPFLWHYKNMYLFFKSHLLFLHLALCLVPAKTCPAAGPGVHFVPQHWLLRWGFKSVCFVSHAASEIHSRRSLTPNHTSKAALLDPSESNHVKISLLPRSLLVLRLMSVVSAHCLMEPGQVKHLLWHEVILSAASQATHHDSNIRSGARCNLTNPTETLGIIWYQ